MYGPPPGSVPNPFASMRARLRPMGIGDILDETFRLYRENFVLFIAIIAVVDVPAQIISLLLSASAPTVLPFTPGQTPTNAQLHLFLETSSASNGATSLRLLVVLVSTAIMAAALAVASSQRYLGQPATLAESCRATISRSGPLLVAILWTTVRFILLTFACVILIGIPFLIYFTVAWTLLSQVVMLENSGGIAASRRSRELIRGYWWKTCGLLIVTGLLTFILGRIPQFIVEALVAGSGVGAVHTRFVVEGIAGLIIDVLVRPISLVATTLLFYDLKIRKEAFDLEAMVQQTEALPTPDYTRY